MNYENVFKDKEKIKQIELKLDLLTEEQVEELQIFAKCGRNEIMTDFARLCGGYSNSWWTKSPCENIVNESEVYIVTYNGIIEWREISSSSCGIRPYLPYSSISKFIQNSRINSCDIKEVEFGEYPQWIVDKNYSIKLESEYCNGNLKMKKLKNNHIYEYKGEKYIRFECDPYSTRNFPDNILSDNRKIEYDKAYWVKIEPIIWLVDKESDIAITKHIIASGIPFNYKGDYYYIEFFNSTTIKYFLDELAVKIMPNIINYKIKKEETIEETIEKSIKQMTLELQRLSSEFNLEDKGVQKVKKI